MRTASGPKNSSVEIPKQRERWSLITEKKTAPSELTLKGLFRLFCKLNETHLKKEIGWAESIDAQVKSLNFNTQI